MPANTIFQHKLVDDNKRALLKYVYVSDGTNSGNNVLVDVSSLNYAMNVNNKIIGAATDYKSQYRTSIKRIFGSTKLTGHIALKWHGDANSDIVRVGGTGSFDFDFESMGRGATIGNPEANSSGDILISTIASGSNDTFTIFIDMVKDSRDYDAGQTSDNVAFNR